MTGARPGLVLVALLLEGCVFLAVPTPEHGLVAGRGVVDEALMATLQPGVTTREDVLLQFGEPDATIRHERLFVYRWDRVQGYWLFVAGGGYSGVAAAGTIPRKHLLLLEFGDDGTLRRFEHSSPTLTGQPTMDRLLGWAGTEAR